MNCITVYSMNHGRCHWGTGDLPRGLDDGVACRLPLCTCALQLSPSSLPESSCQRESETEPLHGPRSLVCGEEVFGGHPTLAWRWHAKVNHANLEVNPAFCSIIGLHPKRVSRAYAHHSRRPLLRCGGLNLRGTTEPCKETCDLALAATSDVRQHNAPQPGASSSGTPPSGATATRPSAAMRPRPPWRTLATASFMQHRPRKRKTSHDFTLKQNSRPGGFRVERKVTGNVLEVIEFVVKGSARHPFGATDLPSYARCAQ